MSNPIWKDYFVNLGTAESVLFRITNSAGEVVYSGRSYKKPNETNNSIRINEVCADYIKSITPSFSVSRYTPYPVETLFIIEVFISTAPDEPEDWEELSRVSFVNEWSFDYNHLTERDGLACPITGRVSPRQRIPFTSYTNTTGRVTLTGGDEETEEIRAKNLNVVDLEDYQGVEKFSVGSVVYKVQGDCYRYVLYYLNAWGGFDTLLIEGEVTESEEVTRETRSVSFDNRLPINRGTENYLNELKKSFVLRTGFLTDEESARMNHLLNSPEVYLEDLNNYQVVPVVLTSTNHALKSFRNQGRRFFEYEINAEVANQKTRR